MAIHPQRFDKLITSLRTAVEQNKGIGLIANNIIEFVVNGVLWP